MDAILPKRVVIPEDVIISKVEQEIVLLNLDSEQYYALDDIGARIWELLNENGETEAVVEQITAEYDVSDADFRQDLATLVMNLQTAGLVSIVE
jgi:hypothetical protein